MRRREFVGLVGAGMVATRTVSAQEQIGETRFDVSDGAWRAISDEPPLNIIPTQVDRDNPDLFLEPPGRGRLVNRTGNTHPFEIRAGDGSPLLSQSRSGDLEDEVSWEQRQEPGNVIMEWDVTENLVSQLSGATYVSTNDLTISGDVRSSSLRDLNYQSDLSVNIESPGDGFDLEIPFSLKFDYTDGFMQGLDADEQEQDRGHAHVFTGDPYEPGQNVGQSLVIRDGISPRNYSVSVDAGEEIAGGSIPTGSTTLTVQLADAYGLAYEASDSVDVQFPGAARLPDGTIIPLAAGGGVILILLLIGLGSQGDVEWIE